MKYLVEWVSPDDRNYPYTDEIEADTVQGAIDVFCNQPFFDDPENKPIVIDVAAAA